jgi:hypothetical protein
MKNSGIPWDIRERTFQYALRAIKLFRYLEDKPIERVGLWQSSICVRRHPSVLILKKRSMEKVGPISKRNP